MANGAPARPIHQRAWAKHQAGQRLAPLERVALLQLNLDASTAAGEAVTAPGYSGGARGQLKRFGKKVGGVVKTVAPIAALAIPGLGPVAAGALAAGGRATGRALQGERFDPLDTLKAGVVGGAGRFALGRLGSGAGSAAGSAADVAGGAAGGGGVGGFLSRAGSSVLDFIKEDPLRAAQLGLAGVGVVQGAKTQGEADALRRRSLGRLDEPPPVDLSAEFDDPFNPFAGGTAPSRTKRAAVRSLIGRAGRN